MRRDVIHKATSAIIAIAPSVIVLEDLNVKGMMQDSHIARALGDAAIGEFRRQLEYKCEWAGIRVVIADRWFPSSKTCSGCGAVKPELDRGAKTYICESCDLVIDRDMNAAVNLAQYGETTPNNPRGSTPGTDVEDGTKVPPVKRQPGAPRGG
jgi:putative transposase